MRLLSLVVCHMQRCHRAGLHHLSTQSLCLAKQMPEQLSRWLLCRQEALGVLALPRGLQDMHQQWHLQRMPAQLDAQQEGQVHCGGQ